MGGEVLSFNFNRDQPGETRICKKQHLNGWVHFWVYHRKILSSRRIRNKISPVKTEPSSCRRIVRSKELSVREPGRSGIGRVVLYTNGNWNWNCAKPQCGRWHQSSSRLWGFILPKIMSLGNLGARWVWLKSVTSPEEVTEVHIKAVYRLDKNVCQFGNCEWVWLLQYQIFAAFLWRSHFDSDFSSHANLTSVLYDW